MGKAFAAAVSVAVLLAGAAADARDERGQWPLPPPDGPWPATGTFLIHLCRDDSAATWEACEGGGATTDAERWVIEGTLASLPEVATYGRMTSEEALAIARQDWQIGYILTADLMRESYGGTLRPGDWRALLRTLAGLPGVGVPIAYRDDFWWGKADVSVALCPEVSLDRFARACEGRGRATEAERQAVLDRIREVRGIEKIYVEDPAHAAKVRDHLEWHGGRASYAKGPFDEFPETFYVKLADPGAAARIEKSVAGLAGVAVVAPVAAP
ncbi:permease-like cell division protein FtsX [Microtetraspora niveoalba]|uniref:permease-like cell division protein FtsX n=1 Tax=Microtetraspora niveoalba TaxID=46175 RepID=UPI00082B4434|nr:permease-like cell division protein FtsX [Microtetraspora niveoalba]